MNRVSCNLLGAVIAAAAISTPAFAEKSDRAFIEEMRTQIDAARAEPGVARAGTAELAEAEARLPELYKALDDNEAADARAARNGINALIDAARLRARIARPEPRPATYTPPATAIAAKPVHRVATKRRAPARSCLIASR